MTLQEIIQSTTELDGLMPDLKEKILANLRYGLFAPSQKLPNALLEIDLDSLPKLDYPIFAPGLNPTDKIAVYMPEYCECEVALVDGVKPLNFTAKLTLPSAELLFEGEQYEEMDIYEEWASKVSEQLGLYDYIQIGGHGRWIQRDYSDTYIGQIDVNVGDAGQIFITYNKEFAAWVDMY